MQRIDFWFDPISPFAYLAFERLPQALEGLSYQVVYKPVLFAGLLAHWGQKGPAEIEPKRAWTFRHLHWQAQQWGIPMHTPIQHPFNPLPLLRLAQACGPNRRVVEAVMRHVWRAGGADACEPGRLAALERALDPPVSPQAEEVKAGLRKLGQDAIVQGVFGVPTLGLDGRLFWGLDSLPMLRDALAAPHDRWAFKEPWAQEGAARQGVQRKL